MRALLALAMVALAEQLAFLQVQKEGGRSS